MIWLTITCMALITFVNRYAFFVEGLRYQPSVKVKRFLSYSSYAVLTSIWAPILFQLDFREGSLAGLSYAGLDYLIAASLAAVLTMLYVRSIIVVLLSSGVFFCLRLFVFAQ